MKKIKTSANISHYVDDEDFIKLSKFKYHEDGLGYARRNTYIGKRNGTVRLHTDIMNTPIGMLVDHIDGNKRNCQKSNLRICTKSENMHNINAPITNRTGFKGVSFNKQKGKFEVRARNNGKTYKIGTFESFSDAKEAYRTNIPTIHGEFARISKTT